MVMMSLPARRNGIIRPGQAIQEMSGGMVALAIPATAPTRADCTAMRVQALRPEAKANGSTESDKVLIGHAGGFAECRNRLMGAIAVMAGTTMSVLANETVDLEREEKWIRIERVAAPN
jgi:hypothetical protein